VRFGIFRTLASMGRLLEVLGIATPGEAVLPAPRGLIGTDDIRPRREDLVWSVPAAGPRADQADALPAAPPPPGLDARPPASVTKFAPGHRRP